jgi:DNA-binding GntR family transcriptional regulator
MAESVSTDGVRVAEPYADGVYVALKQLIADGRVRPGQRLREIELAGRFGVSRTPVREALRKLEAEGLVASSPGGGLAVTVASPQEIMDAYLVREALEGLAARLAAERATDVDVLRLDATLRQIRAAAEAGEFERAVALSNQFDAVVFGASRSERLAGMIEAARAAQGRSLRASLRAPGRMAQAIEERAEILQAIRGRRPEAAEQATRTHLRRAREARLAQSLEDDAWAP